MEIQDIVLGAVTIAAPLYLFRQGANFFMKNFIYGSAADDLTEITRILESVDIPRAGLLSDRVGQIRSRHSNNLFLTSSLNFMVKKSLRDEYEWMSELILSYAQDFQRKETDFNQSYFEPPTLFDN